MTPASARVSDGAFAALARLSTTTGPHQPTSVRTLAVFDRPPTNIALPLNRKTTQQAIVILPLAGLEPRQEFVTVQGLESYIVRPRRDPPDVARVQMRDGTERLLVQEGHTRLGAALLRGEGSMPVRVWEFQQTDTGGFEPIIRGRHRIGHRYRDRLQSLAGLDLGGAGSGNFGHAGRPGEVGGSGAGDTSDDKQAHAKGVAIAKLTKKFGADWVDMLEKIQAAKLGDALLRGELDEILDLKPVTGPTANAEDRAAAEWGIAAHRHETAINLPDSSDVNFPTLIGAIPAKRKRRKPVQYKGVKLSRHPMAFEAKVLSLDEIPPRLDMAVLTLTDADATLVDTVMDMTRFGVEQALLELVRQGAPDAILTVEPPYEEAARELAAALLADRTRDLDRARQEATVKLSQRRIPPTRRIHLARELFDRYEPGIVMRHAKRAVNTAFALGRSAVIDHYRRPHEPVHLAYHDDEGKFTGKFGALVTGDIWVDKVIHTAVMDTNTCEECEAVDGEVMELGDDRQQELHPPYVKCLGGDKCRCIQIALLSDGSEVEVDELPDDAYDE